MSCFEKLKQILSNVNCRPKKMYIFKHYILLLFGEKNLIINHSYTFMCIDFVIFEISVSVFVLTTSVYDNKTSHTLELSCNWSENKYMFMQNKIDNYFV